LSRTEPILIDVGALNRNALATRARHDAGCDYRRLDKALAAAIAHVRLVRACGEIAILVWWLRLRNNTRVRKSLARHALTFTAADLRYSEVGNSVRRGHAPRQGCNRGSAGKCKKRAGCGAEASHRVL